MRKLFLEFSVAVPPALGQKPDVHTSCSKTNARKHTLSSWTQARRGPVAQGHIAQPEPNGLGTSSSPASPGERTRDQRVSGVAVPVRSQFNSWPGWWRSQTDPGGCLHVFVPSIRRRLRRQLLFQMWHLPWSQSAQPGPLKRSHGLAKAFPPALPAGEPGVSGEAFTFF